MRMAPNTVRAEIRPVTLRPCCRASNVKLRMLRICVEGEFMVPKYGKSHANRVQGRGVPVFSRSSNVSG